MQIGEKYPVLIALIFITSVWLQFYTLPCFDLAGLSYETVRMFQGAIIYRDTSEPSPPLIFWVYALPVKIALMQGWPPFILIRLFTTTLIALSLLTASAILKKSSLWEHSARRSFMTGIAGLLLLSADTYIVFAQREHLLIILLLPYILLYLPSVKRASIPFTLQVIIGICAGIGLCLKPHFFAIWLLVLISRSLLSRSVRGIIGWMEILILAVGVIYTGLVMLFFPQYFEWLPRLIAVYGQYNNRGESTLDKALWFAELLGGAGVLAAIFGLFSMRGATPYRRDMLYLMGVALGAYLEALLQFKTWDYIAYPFLALGMLAIMAIILLKPVTHMLAIIVMGWLFFPSTPFNDNRQDTYKIYYQRVMAAIKPYQHAKSIYYASLIFPPAQMYRTEEPLRWTNKFSPFSVVLSGTMQMSPHTDYPVAHVRPGKEGMQQWLFDNILDNLEKDPPELLAIEHRWSTLYPEESFDFLQWFRQDPRIARILDGYTPVQTTDTCGYLNNAPSEHHCDLQIFIRKIP